MAGPGLYVVWFSLVKFVCCARSLSRPSFSDSIGELADKSLAPFETRA
jgi:hypothetical protein